MNNLTEKQLATFLQSTEAALVILNRSEEIDISELRDVLDPMMEIKEISQLYDAIVSGSYDDYDSICYLEEFHSKLLSQV